MAEPEAEFHLVAERSSTGGVTALCGFTAEAGDYTMVYFGLSFLPRCQECKRLKRTGS
jgi:hypothetical protein